MTGTSEVLRRDGHLLGLAVSRYVCEPVSAEFRALVDEHLAGCAACREHVETVQNQDAACQLTPPAWLIASAAQASGTAVDQPDGAPVTTLASRRRRATIAAMAAVAIAAAALFVVAPASSVSDAERAEFRRKGGALDLEVYVHDGTRARLADDGTIVHEGDRAGFRIWPRRDGHLMIVGVDARQDVYVCYPQQGQGRSTMVQATAAPIVLNEAVRFDGQLGAEHLYALICDEPFSVADVTPQLRRVVDGVRLPGVAPALRAGCVQQRLVLDKRATGGER